MGSQGQGANKGKEIGINTMAKKYEFTGETQAWRGRTLHRIRALRSFDDVKVGDLGGWIEKEENLDHNGSAWVYEEAKVYGSAKVSGAAEVSEAARVSGGAWVFGESRVYGAAKVSGDARVFGTAEVLEDAKVYGSAWVSGSAEVFGAAEVSEAARVSGGAWVFGESRVYGAAKVSGDARVFGTAEVLGDAKVCGNARIRKTSHYLNIGPIGSRLNFTTFFRAEGKQIYVKCGCFSGDIEEFAAAVQATHGNNQHAKAYMAAIVLAKMQIDLTGEDSEA